MLFNSLDFALFLPIVFALYWFVFQKNLRAQNALVFIASYVFYGWWDWRFLSLILFSTAVDFLVGIQLGRIVKSNHRKAWLWVSILVNLGFLGFFKYYNFFLENFSAAFSLLGHPLSIRGLDIVLPVGISFYTFQTMSYSIDVYRNKLNPTSDFIAFGAFVSFFPQLVAGPIERASNLLPQFYAKRNFNYSKSVDGCRQILWGLFKKVVIADNCALYVNQVFENYQDFSGSTLLIAAVFFAFQIYGDFSGYSDIAIGTAKLFGFTLMQNFAFPYFSRDIAEFWRRWHISLSTWFRDYVYIPLGGSRGGKWQQVRNTFIIFLVSGVWHGANWTFVMWGALNAVYFLPLLLLGKNRKNTNDIAQNTILPSIHDVVNISFTFGITTIGWVFFRSENINSAISFLYDIFYFSQWEKPLFPPKTFLIILTGFIFIEWLGRNNMYAIEKINKNLKKHIEVIVYYILLSLIITWSSSSQEFIYFTF